MCYFRNYSVMYAVHAMGVPCCKPAAIGIATGKAPGEAKADLGRFLVNFTGTRGLDLLLK
jgi:hypothetical protein